VRFFCPGCWKDFTEDFDRCPNCGLEIRQFWASKDYIEKLILALNHPEKSTPVRAARILGRLRNPGTVSALIGLIGKTKDVYLAVAAIHALRHISTPEAVNFLETLRSHPARVMREAVNRALSHNAEPSAHNNKRAGQ
jgi:HEAT repeat protein